jgi:hypothetical protein
MSDGVSGDFGELDTAIARLDALASYDRMGQAATSALESTVRAQWAAGVGPDGKDWRPNRDGSVSLAPIAARASFTWNGQAIVITIDDKAAYHRGLRPMFPRTDVVPPIWRKVIEGAARKHVQP